MIAGISFDNGLLHLTHALEHPLSGLKPDLAHGLGLGIILPAVVKQIYPAKAKILADILAPIVPGLQGIPDEADRVYKELKVWLKEAGIKERLSEEGFSAADVDKLVKLAFETPSLDSLLGIAPIEATEAVVRKIYLDSM